MPPPPGNRSADTTIVALCARQRRVVARWQLVPAGVPADVIDRRIRAGRLHVVHRGVYVLAHPELEWLGRVSASVLAGGPRAVSGHRTAAELHGLRDGGRRVFDIVVPRARTRVAGVTVHRARDLRSEDVASVHGIPVTTVARTLLDRARVASREELRAELNQARHQGNLDVRGLEAQLERHRGHPGAAELRRLVRLLPDRTASELEDAMLAVLRRAGLPEPEVNHPFRASGRSVRTDFRWPLHRLVVEVDGGEYHRDREADYARDLDLRLAGWDVLRFTWHQVQHEPERVVAGVRLALATRRAAG